MNPVHFLVVWVEGWSKFVEHIHSPGNDTHNGIALAGGLTFASGYGDGEYTVYGYKDEEGNIMKVEIDMMYEEDED